MKARNLIFAGFVFAAASGFAQSIDSSIHVNQFPGSTVAAKLTNAMATCPTNVQVPCILVLDPSLAPMTNGTFPSLCSHCYLSDYRTGPPMGACGSNPCPIASGGTSGVNGAQATGNLAKAAGEGIWKRIGAVDYGPPGTKLMEEPTVIVDTNPELLTAYPTVYKKWGSYGTAIGYAESVDGVQWDQGGIVIPNHFRSSVLPISGTYYLWGRSFSGNQIDIYSSPNGYTNWTDVCPAALPTGSAPFSQTDLENSGEIVFGGTLYLFVEVPAGIGLYTSTPGSCTYTAVSLVIPYTATNFAAGPTNPFLINGKWYMWTHGACPAGNNLIETCIERMEAPALTGPWTDTGITELSPRTLDEGLETAAGQVADPSILPDITAGIPPDPTKGKTLLYYTATQQLGGQIETLTIDAAGTGWAKGDKFFIAGGAGGIGEISSQSGGNATVIALFNQGSGYTSATGAATTAISPSTGTGLTVTTTASGANYVQETKLAVADMPMSSLVQTSGGDDVGHMDNPSLLGQSFDYPNQAVNENGFGIENVAGFFSILNPYFAGSPISGTPKIEALADGNMTVDLGCSVTAPGENQCSNGNLTLNLDTSTSGYPFNAALKVGYNGGEGLTFTLPRNVNSAGFRINNNGNTQTLLYVDSSSGEGDLAGPLVAKGYAATLGGCSIHGSLGGAFSGLTNSGTSGTCTFSISPGVTAPNGYSCWANDVTTPSDVLKQTAFNTTSATISGTTVSNDVIVWGCIGF